MSIMLPMAPGEVGDKDDRYTLGKQRVRVLSSYVEGYLKEKAQIPTGFSRENMQRTSENRQRILEILGGNEEDWDNWKWHMQKRHITLAQLEQILNLSDAERAIFNQAREDSLVAMSPYFLSLADRDNPHCPIRLQIMPHADEYNDNGYLDPSGEATSSPVPGWVQRYPDRGIIYVNDIGACAVACRFCQRRHNMSPKELEFHSAISIRSAIEYVRKNPAIRDILLTGGDALALGNTKLEWILRELRQIEHVEIIRLATRLPITLPQRVTDDLCEMIGKYSLSGGHGAIWVVTHINHPLEITPEVARASLKLMAHGLPILNQSVLLAGINDSPEVMMCLNQQMVRIGIKPYYLFHCKSVDGAMHFRTSLQKGMEIMQYMNGRTSGLAIPSFVISAHDGKGKVRLVTPEQLHETETPGVWRVRTWEGDEVLYDER